MPKRILAADDSRTVRQAISYTFLKEPAVELLLASGGNEALELLSREPIDLLLLDYQMPDIDGMTLCARLKQEPQLAHIPILLLTGRNYDPSQTEKIGADGAIPKPFLTDQLIRRAAELLSFQYTPAPLSIAEELGERRADSIEIDIDLGDLGGGAPPLPKLAPGPPPGLPPAMSNPQVKPFSPAGRPGTPTPGRAATGGHTPMLMPEKELPFHGGSFAPPPPSALGRGAPGDMIIDDLPYDAAPLPHATPLPLGARGGRPGTPPLPGAPPLPGRPQGPGGIPLPGLPPLGTAPTPLAPSQSSLPSVKSPSMATRTTPNPPSAKEEELEVLVGQPVVESFPPKPSNPEELDLPMEDEPQAAPKSFGLPPSLQGLGSPLAEKPFPKSSKESGTAPSLGLPLGSIDAPKAPAGGDLMREGAYLQSNKASDNNPSGRPAPTPLPPFAPKEPPKRPKGRVSPQATQKFRMLDLLGESDLSTTGGVEAKPPSVVAVDSLLPTSEVKTISSLTEDILDIEVSETANKESTQISAPPEGLASLTSATAKTVEAPVFPPLPSIPSAASQQPLEDLMSDPFEKMTGPAPILEEEQDTKRARGLAAVSEDDLGAAVVVGTVSENTEAKDEAKSSDAIPIKARKRDVGESAFEIPFVSTSEEEEQDDEGTSIRVQAGGPKGANSHPTTESAASFSMVVEEPVAPCPPEQIQLQLGASLNLRELAWLLQFADHASQLIATRLGEEPTLPIFINSQRRSDATILSFGGEQSQLVALIVIFLECWPNLQDEDKEALQESLLGRLPSEERPQLQRILARLNVDVQPYIQALRRALPLLQDTPLERCVSGLSTPSATLFEDDGISSMVVSEPLQKERDGLVKALQQALELHALSALLQDEFSLSVNDIVSPGLPAESIYLAVIYHFELRYQIPDLADVIQEAVDSFEPAPFVKYPGN